MDPKIERMADVLVNYCIGVKEDEWVVIQTTVLGEPIADACCRAILRAGGNPTPFLGSERIEVSVLREASDRQLANVPPVVNVIVEQADAQMGILAPANTRSLSGVDPARLALRSRAMQPISERIMQRTAEGTFRWTVAQFPTEAAAQDAGMDLEEYADFVYSACLLDQPDPVVAWRGLIDRQQQLIDWISHKRTVHIEGPGTDLTVGIEGRAWINDDGKVNFPGGEIFTGPVEDATEGVIQFTFPATLRGREATDVRLVFERGVVVEATATSGEDYLSEMLNMDEGAKRLGEFAFGTNYGIQRHTRNTLFDEKIGGTLHMALGESYPQTGGTNKSALHWDMVYDLRTGSRVTVDGTSFSENGQFSVPDVVHAT